jgi:hypothetical protein
MYEREDIVNGNVGKMGRECGVRSGIMCAVLLLHHGFAAVRKIAVLRTAAKL